MPDPYARVLASLNRRRVRYLTIGGMAAILHGVPRNTLDMDILIDPTESNVRRLLAALAEVGFGTVSLTSVEEILSHEATIFEDYVRLDVLTHAKGIDFASVWPRRMVRRVRGVPAKIISLADLIVSKEACGRPQDVEDARLLRRIRSRERT